MLRCRVVLLLVLAASPAVCGDPPRTDRFGDPLPAGAIARAGSIRWRHAASIQAVVYSPDGAILASGGMDECIYLWDALGGKEVRCIHDLLDEGSISGQVWSLAFSRDGKSLAVGRRGKTLLVETKTGKLIRTLDHERVALTGLLSRRQTPGNRRV